MEAQVGVMVVDSLKAATANKGSLTPDHSLVKNLRPTMHHPPATMALIDLSILVVGMDHLSRTKSWVMLTRTMTRVSSHKRCHS